MGGFGPFFTSFVYNEVACFYTFKVCYVWSSKEVDKGEPQYAELIEMQMVPKDGNTCFQNNKDVEHPGLELRLSSDKLNEVEWPSINNTGKDDNVNQVKTKAGKNQGRNVEPRFQLQWTSNVNRSAANTKESKEDKRKRRDEMRGRVCLEDPRSLAEATGIAVKNRLARGCCKEHDWEKVSTDELRAAWLHTVTQRKGLEKFGVPGKTQEAVAGVCQSTLHIRKLTPETKESKLLN